METLGSRIDRLQVTNQKMFFHQEYLYKIRRMSLEEFKEAYKTEESMEELYLTFKKACDLNVQRNNQIESIDEFIVELIEKINNSIGMNPPIDTSKFICRPQKTY